MVKILLNMKKFSQKKKDILVEQKEDEKACPSFAPTVCTHKKNGLSPLLKNIILFVVKIVELTWFITASKKKCDIFLHIFIYHFLIFTMYHLNHYKYLQ